jgi:hypothetical protein
MLMQNAKSGDRFGVNFNWNYILLQIRETCEDFEEARIKLTLDDVDALINDLQYFQRKLKLWKESVGAKMETETEEQYCIRIYQNLRDNNYFVGQQEE